MNNDRKISFLLMSFRPGGGERNMVNLANSFAKRGYHVDIPVIKPVGEYKDQVHKNVRVLSLDAGRILFSFPKLISYLKKEQPDVIIATDEYTHIMSLVCVRLSRVKICVILRIGNMFSVLFERYNGCKNKIIAFVAKKIYRYADVIVANSFGVACDISDVFSVPFEEIKIVYNPKEIDQLKKKAEKHINHPWLQNKKELVVLSVGRLREQKDLDTMLRAFNMVRKDISARLILVGQGREQKRLECLVEELGLQDSVSFVGYSDNPYAYMARSDVFITTSLWEGLSNSLIEAMVCGMPIIATDCSSGPREVMAPSTNQLFRRQEGVEYAEFGVLVPVGGVKEVAEALKEMLRKEALRKKYRQRSLERSADFESEKILDRYAEIMGIN